METVDPGRLETVEINHLGVRFPVGNALVEEDDWVEG